MSNTRIYKDSVFRKLFTNEQNIRDLYGALKDTHYSDDVPVEIKTIDDVTYGGIKNDLAFTIDNKFIVLIEHQSTINGNMPARLLMYFSQILRGMISGMQLYQEKNTPIPTPEFYVFYNGQKDLDTETVLKLSDCFIEATQENSVELVAKVINVKYNKGAKVLDNCKLLKEYSIFIDLVDQYRKVFETRLAIAKAIDECIEKEILREFLLDNRAEVLDSMYDNITAEEFAELRAEEQYNIGKEEGLIQGKNVAVSTIASAMKAKGMAIADIVELTSLTKEQIEAL